MMVKVIVRARIKARIKVRIILILKLSHVIFDLPSSQKTSWKSSLVLLNLIENETSLAELLTNAKGKGELWVFSVRRILQKTFVV